MSLSELLVKNAGTERTTSSYYTILRFNLIDIEGEGIKGIAETAFLCSPASPHQQTYCQSQDKSQEGKRYTGRGDGGHGN
jgi:hypothetical protein